jgi:hypothetical protein
VPSREKTHLEDRSCRSRGLQPCQGAGTPPKDSIGVAAARTKVSNEIDLRARIPSEPTTAAVFTRSRSPTPKIDLSRPGTSTKYSSSS